MIKINLLAEKKQPKTTTTSALKTEGLGGGQNFLLIGILLIGVAVAGVVIPEFLRLPIHMLGQVSIPLLLFSLGVRMISIDLKDWGIGAMAALICPLRSP